MSAVLTMFVSTFVNLQQIGGLMWGGANRYWIASAESNWNAPENWSTSSGGMGGASVPTDADIAIFDGGGIGDCRMDVGIQVSGIQISRDFGGRLSQGNSDMEVRGDGFVVAGGQFEGGTGNINLTGSLEISGGTFVSTSGHLYIQGSAEINGSSFQHNSGTIEFNGSGNRSYTVIGSAPFLHNLILNLNNKALTISAGDSLYVRNKAILSNGKVNTGYLAINDSCQINEGWDNGNATLTFVGDDNAWLIFNNEDWSGNDVHVSLNSPSDTAFVYDQDGNGTLQFGGNSQTLTIHGGVLAFEQGVFADLNFGSLLLETGGILLGSSNEIAFQGNYNNSGGTYSHNHGQFTFDGQGNRTFSSNSTSANQFHDLQVKMGNNKTLTISSGDSLYAHNKALLNNGKLNTGHLIIDDSCQVNAGWDNGNTTLSFVGDDNAWLIFNNDNWSGNGVNISLDSPVDTAFVYDQDGDGIVQFGSSSQTLTVNGGVMDFEPGVYADLNFGNLLLETGGILHGSSNEIAFQGNYNNSGGTYSHNEGQFTFDGQGDRSFSSNRTETNEFYDLKVNMGNNKVFTLSDTLAVANELMLNNGKIDGSPMQVRGDVSASSIDGGNAALIFHGNSKQSLSLTGSRRFNGDVYLRQAVADTVELLSDFIMDASGQALTFDKGFLLSSDTTLLTLGDNVTVRNASDSSYVYGPMQKIGNNRFEFPVGKDSAYAPISISAPSSSSHAFLAEYFRTSPSLDYDQEAVEEGIQPIGSCEYWVLRRSSGNSQVNVTLSFTSQRSCGVADLTETLVAKWDGTEWTNQGNGGTSGDLSAGTISTDGAVSYFNAFTFAQTTNSVLPIELAHFAAYPEHQRVAIEWQTASEINNDYFTVERSIDGRLWQDVAQLKGAGNSSAIQHYKTHDAAPPTGRIYYRLKQTDFDGNYSLSELQEIQWAETELLTIQTFPNPVLDFLTVEGSPKSLEAVQVFNTQRMELTSFLSPTYRQDGQMVLDVRSLPSGIYLVTNGHDTKKVCKK